MNAMSTRTAPRFALVTALTLLLVACAQLTGTPDDALLASLSDPITPFGTTELDTAAQQLLTESDTWVETGELQGVGPGKSADQRLKTLRNMLTQPAT